MQASPAPTLPLATAAPQKRRPGMIALGVVLLLGAAASGFSTTVWLESRERTLAHRAELKDEAKRYGWTKKELEEKVEQQGKWESEATLYVALTAGGALVGLCAGLALLVLGARRRPA